MEIVLQLVLAAFILLLIVVLGSKAIINEMAKAKRDDYNNHS